MTKEQTPITAEEFFNNGGDIIESCFGTKYSKTDLNPIKFAEQYAQYRERKAVLEALEDKYSHDDITHALAYGYKGAKSHLTHSEVLKRYKESNMKQK